MAAAYVLDGPAGCGNAFGYYHACLIPDGYFAIVRDGEYANGGYGPSTIDGKRYRTRELAETARRRCEK